MYIQMVFLCLFIILLVKLTAGRYKDLPPGEWGLPIIGSMPFTKGNIKRYFNEVKHKYGNIFCIQVGQKTLVFLRDYETIKKHLTKDELAERPYIFSLDLINLFSKTGIVFANGSVWKANRRFSLRHLRDFGLGKASKMQEIILQESEKLVRNLEEASQEPINPIGFLRIPPLNVIWSLVAGAHFDQANTKVHEIFEDLETWRKIANGPMLLLNFFPSLIQIIPNFIKNRWMKLDTAISHRMKIQNTLMEFIEEHRRTLDRSNPRDYIDAYLIELEEKKEMDFTFVDPTVNLVNNINDLFLAGSETTSNTLHWFMLFMAAHPDIQQKVQKEIDSVLPQNQLPLLDDKNKLPYLQACVYESLRLPSLIPFSLDRTVQQDYYLDGYRIPKGARILTCVDECHRNPRFWERPNEFYPEHFLDKSGNFKLRTESFIPFGFGKRLCLGESMAKMELFMLAGAIVQNFQISLPRDAKIDLKPADFPVFLNFPNSYKVHLKKKV